MPIGRSNGEIWERCLAAQFVTVLLIGEGKLPEEVLNTNVYCTFEGGGEWRARE